MTARLQFAALLVLGLLPCLACAQASSLQPSQLQSAADSITSQQNPPPAPADGTLSVEYDGTELTVNADDVNLRELLDAVTAKTGVVFDMPDSLEILKVTVQAGPAGLRDALVALLKKQPVDYAIAADSDQPGVVERVVILARREKGPATEPPPAATEPAEDLSPYAQPWSPAFETEQRLIQEAREAEKAAQATEAARQAEECAHQKPTDEKAIEPAENGDPRNYHSGLSEAESKMTPEELYRYWQRAREEQQRKLRDAQQQSAKDTSSPH